MKNEAIEQRFTAALDGLIDHVRRDRSVLAAVLCGSLSHDTVWEKSDIDLALVTADDRTAEVADISLNADGVNVHVFLIPRAAFRKIVESAVHNSFVHSILAKGRLLFTHDDTIADLCARLQHIGARDTDIQLLRAGCDAVAAIYKAHKWFVIREDLDYTALWILYAATPLAQVEVFGRRLLADREVIPQALQLNPAFFRVVYTDLLNTRKTAATVRAALDRIDAYMAARATKLFAPVFEYLREAGEARSSAEIENHFKRNFDASSVTTACEYLSDQRLIGKASLPARLTRKSNLDVQELAFFYIGEPGDAPR